MEYSIQCDAQSVYYIDTHIAVSIPSYVHASQLCSTYVHLMLQTLTLIEVY